MKRKLLKKGDVVLGPNYVFVCTSTEDGCELMEVNNKEVIRYTIGTTNESILKSEKFLCSIKL